MRQARRRGGVPALQSARARHTTRSARRQGGRHDVPSIAPDEALRRRAGPSRQAADRRAAALPHQFAPRRDRSGAALLSAGASPCAARSTCCAPSTGCASPRCRRSTRRPAFPSRPSCGCSRRSLAEGYVARDNMCGGYWVTSRVHELTSGHQGISQIIEAARPFAIELTQQPQMADRDRRARRRRDRDQVLDRHDQPVGAHQHGARAAARPGDDRDGPRVSGVLPGRGARAASRPHARRSGSAASAKRRSSACARSCEQVRADGYATRDPKTKPYRTTTLAMPIREGETVHALISISFFTTALAKCEIAEKIVAPLRATTIADGSKPRVACPIATAPLQRAIETRSSLASRRSRCAYLSSRFGLVRRDAALEPVVELAVRQQPVAVAIADAMVGHVGDLDRRMGRQDRLAVGRVQHQEPVAGRLVRAIRNGLEVVHRMHHGARAAILAPFVERADLLPPRVRVRRCPRTRRPRCSSRARCGPSWCRRRASSR